MPRATRRPASAAAACARASARAGLFAIASTIVRSGSGGRVSASSTASEFRCPCLRDLRSDQAGEVSLGERQGGGIAHPFRVGVGDRRVDPQTLDGRGPPHGEELGDAFRLGSEGREPAVVGFQDLAAAQNIDVGNDDAPRDRLARRVEGRIGGGGAFPRLSHPRAPRPAVEEGVVQVQPSLIDRPLERRKRPGPESVDGIDGHRLLVPIRGGREAEAREPCGARLSNRGARLLAGRSRDGHGGIAFEGASDRFVDSQRLRAGACVRPR